MIPFLFQKTAERMQVSRARKGYILLISILIVGIVSIAIVTSLVFLGTVAETMSLSVQQSAEAMAVTQGCAEYALQQLRTSPAYVGDQTLFLGNGSCDILPIGGNGNGNRILCTEGSVGQGYRRLEIVIKTVLPQTLIDSWQEVAQFSLCQ